MAPKVMILIDNNTAFRFFAGLMDALFQGGRHEILPVARGAELAEAVMDRYPGTFVLPSYDPAWIDAYAPDLVVCYQIWWWDIEPLLSRAVETNIPILHYEHGSLIHRSEFLLEGEEQGSCYRNDVRLCSHIAVWGDRGKECWVSYGVPEEKIFPVGAMHLDHLHAGGPDREAVHAALGIGKDERILFLYTSLAGQIERFDKAQMPFIRAAEAFALDNPGFRLVVKPHPSEMLFFGAPRMRHDPSTVMIVNPIEDCPWPGVTRICVEDVLRVADVVISPFSSALVAPMSLGVPIVLMEYDDHWVRDFSLFCRAGVTVARSADTLGVAIRQALAAPPEGLADLAREFNHGNDGRATGRFIELMDGIIGQKIAGAPFYVDEEEELLASVRRYPFLPYPLYHLIKHYLKREDDVAVAHWTEKYCRSFPNPGYLIKELSLHYLEVRGNQALCRHYIDLFDRYRA